MKKMACFVFLCVALAMLPACSTRGSEAVSANSSTEQSAEKHVITEGQIFQNGSYIYFEDVEILFNDGVFSVRNDRTDDIIITMQVVGVKADGTITLLQMPAFSGIDQAQYEKDLAENGWAVEEYTNRVRAGETLNAVATIFDFSSSGDYPAPDVDGDGYYDIIFCIHPQESADGITVSTDDPESAIYKLKAD